MDEHEKYETVEIGYDATGYPTRINGRKYVGQYRIVEKMTPALRKDRRVITRATWHQILSMQSLKVQIERERLMHRGNQASAADLARADATTRIVARREGRIL